MACTILWSSSIIICLIDFNNWLRCWCNFRSTCYHECMIKKHILPTRFLGFPTLEIPQLRSKIRLSVGLAFMCVDCIFTTEKLISLDFIV